MGLKSEEIEIKVPWGHLAAKAWGNPTDPIVLVFHGILDNAGSFDRLMPHLPPVFYYVCFDLPGHGKSAHFPPFLPLHTSDYVIAYKLIAVHFNRDKYVVMGHSYGGQIGFFFAQLYPEYVEKLILLDTIHAMPVNANIFRQYLVEKFDFCIDNHNKQTTRKRPSYIYEEALDKLQNQRYNGYLTREAAEALLQRSIAPAEEAGKFYFTADQRLKQFMNPLHDFNYIIDTIKKCPVKIPILMILGSQSELQQIYMKPVLQQMKRFKNVRVHYVDGHHDVHNNDPDIVAPLVINFLVNSKAKL